MLTTILIATIIHMNMGFPMQEAILRGIGSAAIIAGIGLVFGIIIMCIVGICTWIKENM